MRPVVDSCLIQGVELGEIDPELLWLAAHLIERDETIVCIEGGVFDPLCHDRAATLLKLHHEPDMRSPLLRSEIFREAQQQNSSKEIKHWFFYRRISPPRREDGTQDDSFVVVGDNSLFGRIGAINRKASEDLTNGRRKHVRCEITIDAIHLREFVEQLSERGNFAAERKLHG
jgi:hypothetical protein